MKKNSSRIVKKIEDYFYEPPLHPPTAGRAPSSGKIDGERQESKPFLNEERILAPKEPLSSWQGEREWNDLRQKALSCHLCVLSRSRTQVVFGDGDPSSMLYIVGEAPGGDEDIQGLPFVGRSGQLLSKMLSAIAIERQDIFITNIVKCRPPSNRDPLPEEIEQCSPYLNRQIQLGNPKIILALGRYSGTFLLDKPKASLSSLREQFHETAFGRVLVTYHPAAVLRSPAQRRPDVWEDLKTLARYLYKEGFYKDSQKQKILETHQVFSEKI